jgi:hypothetical protein
MRHTPLFILLIVLSFAASAQKKVKYDFPEGMADAVKAEYLKRSEKGYILYGINCSACHNTKVGKKEVIPDFTKEQMAKYEMRFTNPSHESSIPETKVTQEEMDLIMTFLKYKAKNK